VFAGVLLDSHWQKLADLLHEPDLRDLTGAERLERREQVDTLLANWCAERSVAEVVDTFSELGLPAVRVNTYAELARESHVASRDMLQTVKIADGKEIPITAPAAKFSRTPIKIRHRAPTLGEHNKEIMAELGYDADELQRLAEIGAI